jgi:hypothetical protein
VPIGTRRHRPIIGGRAATPIVEPVVEIVEDIADRVAAELDVYWAVATHPHLREGADGETKVLGRCRGP